MDGIRLLLHNMLIQSVKDALKGDKGACAFLEDVGADLAYRLGVVSDPDRVRTWARNPQKPDTLDTQQVADMVGCKREYIAACIRRGDIAGFKDVLSGHSNKYAVLPSEARRFTEIYRKSRKREYV